MEQLFRFLPLIFMLLEKREELTRILGPVFSQLSQIAPAGQPAPRLDVKWLQQSLNKILGTQLVVDGDYGESTKAAVRQFQERYMPGESVDGWAGALTTAAIYSKLQEGGTP